MKGMCEDLTRTSIQGYIMNLLYLWSKMLKKARGSAIINSNIDRTSRVESGSHIVNVSFGRNSYCGYDCQIVNTEIGSFCSIADNVVIGVAEHNIDWVSTSPVFREGKDSVKKKYSEHRIEKRETTIIGHDVWIGRNALIKQGVKIGTGAVIGMGSVVTKDVEPYSIVGGCPAKEIKKRFTNEVINELLRLKWWEYDEEKLIHYAKAFNDVNKFLIEVKKG